MARDADPSSSLRRIVTRAALLLVPIVAAGILMPRLVGELGPGAAARTSQTGYQPPTQDEIDAATQAARKLASAQGTWERATTIAPRDAHVDGSGEVVRPFQGFGVSVESRPSAARVVVNGTDLGDTPLVASVDCAPGDRVEIELRKPPLRPQRRTTTCRADTLVQLSVTLAR